ncbi:hypothetical protein MBAV_005408 [Candidatus Magnetobacterium bavaricum]|uniref:Uncharacterized protein n=1 Tax=Candidatus Magnetobacterium bavaricum TaxID=29290 RepID=A0A0F3GKF0_9BACT|nr:hypothetical protein MBAV_005408 [Candidatus Magnetobacterium bavaricum]
MSIIPGLECGFIKALTKTFASKRTLSICLSFFYLRLLNRLYCLLYCLVDLTRVYCLGPFSDYINAAEKPFSGKLLTCQLLLLNLFRHNKPPIKRKERGICTLTPCKEAGSAPFYGGGASPLLDLPCKGTSPLNPIKGGCLDWGLLKL